RPKSLLASGGEKGSASTGNSRPPGPCVVRESPKNRTAKVNLDKSIYLRFGGAGRHGFGQASPPGGRTPCSLRPAGLDYATINQWQKRKLGRPGAGGFRRKKGQPSRACGTSRTFRGDGFAGDEPFACRKIDSFSHAGAGSGGGARIELQAERDGADAAPEAKPDDRGDCSGNQRRLRRAGAFGN